MRHSVSQEAEIESIKSLDKQIEEGKGDTIQLKRTRNSLLAISRLLPPEILGYIFRLSATWKLKKFRGRSETHFQKLERKSYQFLLVCHYWFEVASRTPKLWRCWGTTLEDWNKWCKNSQAGVVPVGLVHIGSKWRNDDFKILLRKLRDNDKIRKLHIQSENSSLMGSIFSCLTPNEGVQEKHIKSIVVDATDRIPEELSEFFAQSRLPSLQCLKIYGRLLNPLWDHLTSQTTCLTILSLHLYSNTRPLSTSQLISILAANPNLQELLLIGVLPIKAENPGRRVQLNHLREISLFGNISSISQLLELLELPRFDDTTLIFENPTLAEMDLILGPCMRDFFQKKFRFKGALSVNANTFLEPSITIDVCGYCGSELEKEGLAVLPSAEFEVLMNENSGTLEFKQSVIKLIKQIPPEHVEHLELDHNLQVPEDLFVSMPSTQVINSLVSSVGRWVSAGKSKWTICWSETPPIT